MLRIHVPWGVGISLCRQQNPHDIRQSLKTGEMQARFHAFRSGSVKIHFDSVDGQEVPDHQDSIFAQNGVRQSTFTIAINGVDAALVLEK